jgi:hypothetical protein
MLVNIQIITCGENRITARHYCWWQAADFMDVHSCNRDRTKSCAPVKEEAQRR